MKEGEERSGSLPLRGLDGICGWAGGCNPASIPLTCSIVAIAVHPGTQTLLHQIDTLQQRVDWVGLETVGLQSVVLLQ